MLQNLSLELFFIDIDSSSITDIVGGAFCDSLSYPDI
jgi:hypothetical protein